MIKVNLLKNRVGDTTQMAQTSMGTGVSGGGGGGGGFTVGLDNREAIVKAAVVFIFTAGLMFYESQNIHTLNARLASLNLQNQELESRAAAVAKEAESIKDIENQARELEDKLKVLKTLSRLRLREVKTLDFVQSSIPEKVWLKGLTYEADKNKFELGHFNFNGNAAATEDLTEFVRRLEDSSYLYEVIVMKNQEVSASANSKAVMREFQFTAQVEVKP
jgi:Tfp pilus assembly protein PilN